MIFIAIRQTGISIYSNRTPIDCQYTIVHNSISITILYCRIILI